MVTGLIHILYFSMIASGFVDDLLTRLPVQRNNTIGELLPHNPNPAVTDKVWCRDAVGRPASPECQSVLEGACCVMLSILLECRKDHRISPLRAMIVMRHQGV